ncbi:glycosyltransferase family 4 protein [Vibrio cyclitrophicus]
MNICFFCNEYPPLLNGGIGTFTKELAEGLVKNNNEVTVIGFYDQTKRISIKKVNGVRLVFLKKSKYFPSVIDRMKSRTIFREVFNKYKFDIVEIPDFLGWGISIPNGKYSKVARLHGSSTYFSDEAGYKNLKYHVWKVLERLSLKYSDDIVSVSQYTAEKTKSIFNLNCQIKIIYNAVKEGGGSRFQCSDYCSQFIFAGSLLEKKGVLDLAKAWVKFSNLNPSARLTFVGKDPEGNWPRIMKIVSESEFGTESISYKGAVSKHELLELYCVHDCAIFPSHAEAFALAPMEAMELGIPVIYSSLTSGKELLEDGVHGFLVNPKDNQQIVDKLILLSSLDKHTRQNITSAAKKHLGERFSFTNFIAENIDYYVTLSNKNNNK